MHSSSMASREREKKGSQIGAKRGTKTEPKDAKMKKAPPKAPFAEQAQKGWTNDTNDDNVCQKGANNYVKQALKVN